MKATFNQCSTFEEKCLVLLTIFIIIFGYPLFLLIFVLIFTYRSIVEKFVHQTDQRFGGMLKGLDAVLSAGSPYTSPEFVLVPVMYLDGVLDRIPLINLFNDRIISERNEKGHPLYPQLRQRIKRKLGYNFWLNVTNFKLENHIKYLNESCSHQLVKQSDIMEITGELCARPFNSEQSPWEILLIPRFQHDDDPQIKSVLIFRSHHCLADGFSIVNMLLRLQRNYSPTPSQNPQFTPDFVQKLFLTLRVLAESPYHALKTMLFSNDVNHWQQKAVKEPTRTFSGQQTAFISLQTLKNIKSTWNMSMASIMTSIVMQGTARVMKKNNVAGNISKLHFVSPVPLPNHPEGLCNHWTFCKIPVNIDILDVEKTARNICSEFERLRFSIIPMSFSMLTNLVGSLPTAWIPATGRFLSSTVIFSNVPGPSISYDVGGCKVLDVFVAGSSPRGCAVGSMAFSYQGRVRYLIGGDQANISPVEASILAEECEKVVQEMVELSPPREQKAEYNVK